LKSFVWIFEAYHDDLLVMERFRASRKDNGVGFQGVVEALESVLPPTGQSFRHREAARLRVSVVVADILPQAARHELNYA
jgi:hypothetical protein